MTPGTLQETLLGNGVDRGTTVPRRHRLCAAARACACRNASSQYYQLVATSGSRGDQSLAVLASDIYLDMEETSLLIARTRQEIARATLMEQLNQSFGIITPEMMEVVGGVKSILFGDEETRELVAGPPEPGQRRTGLSQPT